MNIRGFGGLSKQKSLTSLFSDSNPDMILLQEIMRTSYQSRIMFSKFKLGWQFYAVDTSGLSGGLLASWNPLLFHCKAFSSFAGIFLKASIKGISEILTIFNCYGTYAQRTVFWDNILAGGLLSLPNLLLVDDLNFTISSCEVWGSKYKNDPLGSYFSQLITSNNLVDLSMNNLGPSWRNGRIGDVGISERLDDSLSSAHLLPSLYFFRSRETPSGVLYHYPIFLEWGQRLVP